MLNNDVKRDKFCERLTSGCRKRGQMISAGKHSTLRSVTTIEKFPKYFCGDTDDQLSIIRKSKYIHIFASQVSLILNLVKVM